MICGEVKQILITSGFNIFVHQVQVLLKSGGTKRSNQIWPKQKMYLQLFFRTKCNNVFKGIFKECSMNYKLLKQRKHFRMTKTFVCSYLVWLNKKYVVLKLLQHFNSNCSFWRLIAIKYINTLVLLPYFFKFHIHCENA